MAKKTTTRKTSPQKAPANRTKKRASIKKATATKRAGHAPRSQLTLAETKKLEAARAKKAEDKNANGKLSALDAAAKVLAGSKKPMNAKELIDAMAAKRLWKSPGGQTPDRTLYAAIIREINTKGKDARFKKAGKGQFALMK